MKINFSDRKAVIATMHQKEQIIAPLLAQFGIESFVPDYFDTDRFGTFTRDRARPSGQMETAKLKAISALDLTGEILAIASEGSFFPHPQLPYIPLNRELVLLYDRIHSLSIWGESLSLQTNFNHCQVSNWQEAWEFANKIGFPDHGLIVMPEQDSQERIYKGMENFESLQIAVTSTLKNTVSGKIHLETDMRAHFNPTRQQNIALATKDLIRKIQSLCPSCQFPGFDIIEKMPGLPCEWCGTPTEQIRMVIYGCNYCQFTQEKLFPDKASPSHCSYCNP